MCARRAGGVVGGGVGGGVEVFCGRRSGSLLWLFKERSSHASLPLIWDAAPYMGRCPLYGTHVDVFCLLKGHVFHTAGAEVTREEFLMLTNTFSTCLYLCLLVFICPTPRTPPRCACI